MRLEFFSVLLFGLALLWPGIPLLAQEGESLPAVTIEFPADASFMPRNWVQKPIDAEVSPLDPELQNRAHKILTRALRKYPRSMVRRHLNGVSIVGSLKFYGVSYGGTYMAKARKIVLVYRSSFHPRGFEQRLHHEFSSILLKVNQSNFEAKRWSSSNPPGFGYRADGVIEEQTDDRSEATKVLEAAQKKTGGSGSSLLQLNTELMEEGFLTEYNRVSIEQDVNEVAAHLFTNPEIWAFCQDYPRLDQKVDVLIDFFRLLDPQMDRLYFRNLTRGEFADYTGY